MAERRVNWLVSNIQDVMSISGKSKSKKILFIVGTL